MIIPMRAVCMCFSVLQEPKFRAPYLLKGNSRSFCSIWSEKINISCQDGSNHILKPLGSNSNRHHKEVLEQGKRKKPTTITNKSQSSKQCSIRPNEILDEVVTVDSQLIIKKSKVSRSEAIKYCDVHQRKIEYYLQQRVTILVFDIETTGLSRETESIIEIAFRDLRGGENSTFQTLINPERYVPNSHIHGITTHMVNKPDVPRFKDFIPLLRHFVQSRQTSSAPVMLVAHNARCFDVPFLINEFRRCSEEIPSYWQFLDTLPLVRELAKLESAKCLLGKSIEALREYYRIRLVGNAHRAMSDVHSLTMMQCLTVDLKLPVSSLLERCFTVSDLMNSKKKTKKKEKSQN